MSVDRTVMQAPDSRKVTIFSLPKAFEGHTGMIQHNAVQSWMRMEPKAEIILMGNDPGVAEYAAQWGLRHCPDIKCNEYGTPLISSIYERGQALATTPLVAYVNADIILDGLTAAALSENLPERFLMVGRRTNLMVWDPINFDEQCWLDKLKAKAESEGLLYTIWGIDYFLFNRGLYADIPPFAVGKIGWDNWMLGQVKIWGLPLIAASRAIFALHQEHDYGHVKGGYEESREGVEATNNRAMIASADMLNIGHADHCLRDGHVLPLDHSYTLPPNNNGEFLVLCWQYRIAQQAAIRGEYALYYSKCKTISMEIMYASGADRLAFQKFQEEYYIGTIPPEMPVTPPCRPTIVEEVLARLKRLEPLRTTVEAVDSARMAVVLFEATLDEALAYYASHPATAERMPNIVVINAPEGGSTQWKSLQERYGISITSWARRNTLPQKELCAYSTPRSDFYSDCYGFQQLIRFLKAKDVEVFYIDAAVTQPIYCDVKPDYVEKYLDDICTVYAALADSASKDVFLRSIKCLITGDPGYHRISSYVQYHHPQVPYLEGEVVLEGGAENGSTARTFAQKIGPNGKVYAFEPSTSGFTKLQAAVTDFANVSCEKNGLWCENTTLFLNDAGPGSSVRAAAAPGAHQISCVTIDTFIASRHERCDHIKMDIEGAEYEALHGALHTIRHYRPKMQISLYHKPEDYIRIAQLLLGENLGYKLYMGHHGAWCYETVLYAEPPSRGVPVMQFLEEQDAGAIPFEISLPPLRQPVIAEEVLARLKQLAPLRTTVEIVDATRMAVVLFEATIDEALAYYASHPTTAEHMPNIVVINAPEGGRAEWKLLHERYGMTIVSWAHRNTLLQKELCAYAIPRPDYYKDWYGVEQLVFALKTKGVENFSIDAAVLKPVNRYLRPDYVEKHLDDICVVYAALADATSKDVFLRCIKNIVTGDPGYIPISSYPHYHHPQVPYLDGDVVLEAGADNGTTSCVFAQKVGLSGKVYAFEPNSSGFAKLQASVAEFANVSCEKNGLWCENTTLFLNDAGSGSSVLVAATPEAQQISCVTIDNFIASRHERCDHIKMDIEGAEYEALQGALHTIRHYRPKLQISIYHGHGGNIDYLRIARLLLDENLGYNLYMGHHGAWCYETVLYAEPLSEETPPSLAQAQDAADISVVIYTHNAATDLEQCLDSVLIQYGISAEVIVLDDASTDGTPDLMARYAAEWPALRVVRQPQRIGRGAALDMGFSMATGRYVTFVDSRDVLDADFLCRALGLLQEGDPAHRPQALVCNVAHMDQAGVLKHFGLEPTTLSHEEALDAFFVQKFGGLGLTGKVFDVPLLRRFRVTCEGLSVCGDVVFGMQAFYHAARVRVDSGIAAYRPVQKDEGRISDEFGIGDFLQAVAFLASFCRAHKIDTESGACEYAARTLYLRHREGLCDALQKLGTDSNALSVILGDEVMLALGAFPAVLRPLLADFATLVCHNKSVPQVLPQGANWEEEEAKPVPPQTYTAYGNAEDFDQHTPCLSVIIPNYNKAKYLRECLDSVLSQSMKDFEVLIIDDASNDESYDILRDYADKDKRIRLYRMDYNSLQGVCRNIGMDLARGEFTTFVDSDDWVEPGFFALGINVMRSEQSDVAAFFIKSSAEDKNFSPKPPSPYCTGGMFAAELLVSKESIPWGPCGKMFISRYLRENHIRFPEYIYHQDALFLMNALRLSRICVVRPQAVYTVRMLSNSACRPKQYTFRNLYTEWTFLAQDICNPASGEWHAKWVMEHYWLPVLYAFYMATGTIPLPQCSLALRTNPAGMRIMIQSFARVFCNSPALYDFLPKGSEPSTFPVAFGVVDNPVVSVIIPTYNQEACIARCLDSVLASTLRSLEVIVINDASTDRTLELCHNYAQRDGRIRIFSNECNRGQGYSRNWAQQLAYGRYMTFVDSDDSIAPDFLLYAAAKLERTPQAAWLKGSHVNVYLDGRAENITYEDRLYEGNMALRERILCKLRLYTVWGALYRSKFIRDENICSPEYFFEDNIFLYNAIIRASQLILSSRLCYNYHAVVHDVSTMNPVRQTQRHLSGVIALAKGKALFFKANPDVADIEAQSQGSTLWQFDRTTSYIRACEKNLEPLTTMDLQNLRAAPVFVRVFIQAYANLHRQFLNITPQLPTAATNLRPTYAPSPVLRLYAFHPCQQKIRISVIIPVYRAEGYLAQCLDSILAQNVVGVEVLVVDDCSTDSTLTVAMEYARTHACIRLFQTSRNCGQGIARNLGMQEAKGEYITFVDGDDYLESSFFATGLRVMDADPECDLSVFAYRQEGARRDVIYSFPASRVSGERALADYCAGRIPHWTVWSIIFRKSFIEDQKLVFPAHLYEDTVFILDMYAAARWVRRVPHIAYVYKQTQVSSTQRPRVVGERHLHGMLAYVKYHAVFLQNHPQLSHLRTEFDARAQNLWRYVFRDKVLPYVNSCIVHGLPSPLTNQVLASLCCSDAFLRAIIKDYAELYHKVQNMLKEQARKPQQSQIQPSKKFSAQQHTGQQKQPLQTQPSPGFLLDAGSLLERILWHIAPKRACIQALRRSGMFDVDYYRAKNPDVAQAGVDPIYHYVHFGAAEGRDPAPWFSTRGYLRRHKDVAAAGVNAFYHCLRYGRKEGRGTGVNGVSTPHRVGLTLGMGSLFERALWRVAPKGACIKALRRSGMFDADYYRAENPDVAQAGVDPVYHYVHFGAAEGRDPAPWFSTRGYLQRYEDVAVAGSNAFYHYLRYGREEGRNPRLKG